MRERVPNHGPGMHNRNRRLRRTGEPARTARDDTGGVVGERLSDWRAGGQQQAGSGRAAAGYDSSNQGDMGELRARVCICVHCEVDSLAVAIRSSGFLWP